VATNSRQAFAWKGCVDILVNNAGGGSGLSKAWLFERDPADVAALVETNSGALTEWDIVVLAALRSRVRSAAVR